MSTKTESLKTCQIAREYYGSSAISTFDPCVALWASDRAFNEIGVEATRDELATINLCREKLGLPVAVHYHGHPLFCV